MRDQIWKRSESAPACEILRKNLNLEEGSRRIHDKRVEIPSEEARPTGI